MKAQYSKYFYKCLHHMVMSSRASYRIDLVDSSSDVYARYMSVQCQANSKRERWIDCSKSLVDVKRIGSFLASRPKGEPLTAGGREVLKRCDELRIIYRYQAEERRQSYLYYRTASEIINSDRTVRTAFVYGGVKRDEHGTLIEKIPPAWTTTGRPWSTVKDFGKHNLEYYLACLMGARGATSTVYCPYTLTGNDCAGLLVKFDEKVKVVDAPEGPVRALVHLGNTVGGYPVLGMLDCKVDAKGYVVDWPSTFPFAARVIMFKERKK